MTVIGKFDESGAIETQADECALSGKTVLGEHSSLVRIAGTPYFFRYLSDYEHQLTREKRASIEAQIKEVASPVAVKAKNKSEA